MDSNRIYSEQLEAIATKALEIVPRLKHFHEDSQVRYDAYDLIHWIPRLVEEIRKQQPALKPWARESATSTAPADDRILHPSYSMIQHD